MPNPTESSSSDQLLCDAANEMQIVFRYFSNELNNAKDVSLVSNFGEFDSMNLPQHADATFE